MQKSLKQLLRNPKPAVSYHLDVPPREDEEFSYSVQQRDKNRDMLDILSKGSEMNP